MVEEHLPKRKLLLLPASDPSPRGHHGPCGTDQPWGILQKGEHRSSLQNLQYSQKRQDSSRINPRYSLIVDLLKLQSI